MSAAAVTEDESAWAWGFLGDDVSIETPTEWNRTYDGTELLVGGSVVCERGSDAAWCRGMNSFGEAGVGRLGPVDELELVEAPSPMTLMRFHAGMACGIDVLGDVYCWGSNWGGQLGIRRLPDPEDPIEEQCISTPTKVEGVSDVVALDVDSGACAVEADGDVWCWGFNESLRIRSFGAAVNYPVHLPDVSPAKQVALGQAHACFLRTDDSVWCRGSSLSRGRGGEWAPEDGTATPVDLELLP